MKRDRLWLFTACLFALAACAGVDDSDDDGAAGGDDAARPEIGETGGMCGGIAGFQCAGESDYCKTAPGECVEIADVAGVCTKRPEVCTMDYNPICGCDGETYPNACSAASKGVSVAYVGECPPRE